MELQKFAAREVSALVDRLASHADGLTQERLALVQREHDAVITGLRQRLETQAKELAERTQSEAHHAAAASEARSQVEGLRFELDVQRIALEQQRAEAERQAAAAADHASVETELRETRAALDAAK